MTGPAEYAPYNNKTAKADAEKIKRNLKGLYLKLKAQSNETEAQVSVALKLKTDLHLDRLSEIDIGHHGSHNRGCNKALEPW